MELIPKTRYAPCDGLYIAYQVWGDGPFDLVVIPGFISHVELNWEQSDSAQFYHHLGTIARVIAFDKRGTGLSDRTLTAPTLEERMDDVLAVMDDASSKRAVLLGISEGGPLSILFAATYPQRVEALVIYGSWAKGSKSEDYPWMLHEKQYHKWIKNIPSDWGNPESITIWAPDAEDDELTKQWWGRMLRSGASPKGAINLIELYSQIDVRAILPSIGCPTLILHRKEDSTIYADNGKFLAENIPGAQLIELPGRNHLIFYGDEGLIPREIEVFVTGMPSEENHSRMLATILFTDIVDSTKKIVDIGDVDWNHLLQEHNKIVRREIGRFKGQVCDFTGDGFIATFDGPSRAINCASSIIDHLHSIGLQVRTGIHTGECEIRGTSVMGIAVHIAARVIEHAQADKILISRTVKDLIVGSGFKLMDLGLHTFKGLEDQWQLYEVEHKK